MKLRLSVGSVCLTVVCGTAQAGEFPTCRVPRVLEPPVLDGQLDDAVWKSAPVITDLVTNRNHKPARFRTEFRFVYDAEALYAAVTAHEPNLDKLRIGQDPLTVDYLFERLRTGGLFAGAPGGQYVAALTAVEIAHIAARGGLSRFFFALDFHAHARGW